MDQSWVSLCRSGFPVRHKLCAGGMPDTEIVGIALSRMNPNGAKIRLWVVKL
jgi:hypothetical protein